MEDTEILKIDAVNTECRSKLKLGPVSPNHSVLSILSPLCHKTSYQISSQKVHSRSRNSLKFHPVSPQRTTTIMLLFFNQSCRYFAT